MAGVGLHPGSAVVVVPFVKFIVGIGLVLSVALKDGKYF